MTTPTSPMRIRATPIAGLVTVDPRDLTPNPENPRELIGDVADLAASIAEHGILQPIVTARTGDGGLIIVAGHRRHAAALLLQLRAVPVLVSRPMARDELLAKALVENGQRADLDPIEQARGLARLKRARGCSDLDLARAVGMSQPVVSGRLALLALPAHQQEEIRAGNRTLGQAVEDGRIASGRKRPGATGKSSGFHFGPRHDLARAAASRCDYLAHPRGRRIGAVACGECWEEVLRAAERTHLLDVAHDSGQCPTCGADVEPLAPPTDPLPVPRNAERMTPDQAPEVDPLADLEPDDEDLRALADRLDDIDEPMARVGAALARHGMAPDEIREAITLVASGHPGVRADRARRILEPLGLLPIVTGDLEAAG